MLQRKLISEIGISNVGDKSDILRLSTNQQIKKYSQLILNKLIDVYSNDGIRDKQLLLKNYRFCR